MSTQTAKRELCHIRKTFVRQYSENYCGLACFASIVRYYSGNVSQENLARESGTSILGTSMLGLYQIAHKHGMEAKGYEEDSDRLKEMTSPVILHTVMEGRLEHFVICYGYYNEKFLIGDPGRGIIEYRENELDAIWKSKTLLVLKPGNGFVKKEDETHAKIDWVKALVKKDIPVLSIAAILGVLLALDNPAMLTPPPVILTPLQE